MRNGLLLSLSVMLGLAACSREAAEPTQSEAPPPPAASADEAPVPERTGVLRDPTPEQVRALADAWLGRPAMTEEAARAHPDYLRASAAERPAVLQRLTAEARGAAEAASAAGVLDVSVPVGPVVHDPSSGVYHLPIFSPGSTISLAPSHALRLSNAEAAYALDMRSAAAQAMQQADARPSRVRLTARVQEVQPTANGAILIGELQSFTLYDAEGRAIGEAVQMSAAAPAATG